MSCEFSVHNFNNYSLEELDDMKSEFEYLWYQAYRYKEAIADLPNHETYDEWLKKWDNCCDDDSLYEEAEEYYNEESEGDR